MGAATGRSSVAAVNNARTGGSVLRLIRQESAGLLLIQVGGYRERFLTVTAPDQTGKRPATYHKLPLRNGCACAHSARDFIFCKLMAYPQPEDRLEIEWSPPGLSGGVIIRRRIEGELYEWRVPFNGLVSQAMAADLLSVTKMSVNNWVRDGKVKHVKIPGQPSAIPLSEVKRIKAVLQKQRRLGKGGSGAGQ